MNKHKHIRKLPIMSLMATVSMLGGWVEVVDQADGMYRVTIFEVDEHPMVLRCKGGDDEQLRAILHSLLRSISGSVGPIDRFRAR